MSTHLGAPADSRATTGAGVRGLLRDRARARSLMLWGGGALLPLGLLTILLGWYGTANTPYQYDQISYVVSGGLLGLGLTVVGGFLFFGAWLAQIAEQNRESAERLALALEALAERDSAGTRTAERPVTFVTAGRGTTLHRSDCGLVSDRPDLRPMRPDAEVLTPCRVCRPLDGR